MTHVWEKVGEMEFQKARRRMGAFWKKFAKNFVIYLVEFICVQQEPNFDSMGEKIIGSFGCFIHCRDSFNHIMMQCAEQQAIVSQRPVRPQIIDNIIFCEVMTKNKDEFKQQVSSKPVEIGEN